MSIFDFESPEYQDILLVHSDVLVELFQEIKTEVQKTTKPIRLEKSDLERFDFKNLGTFINHKARHYHYKLIMENFASQPELIYELALKYQYLSISTVRNFFQICLERDLLKETETIKNFVELDPFMGKPSLASLTCEYITSDGALEHELDELFPDKQENFEFLFSLALGSYWLNMANSKFNSNQNIDLNLLGQALDAYEYSHSSWAMWMGDVELSEKMSKNALLRLERDPKQKALADIEKHYLANKAQFKRYGYSAEFIREMHDKYPIIQSYKTIENLVTRLNKKNELIPR